MELIEQIDETIIYNKNTVRILGSFNEPYFVAKDICNILELRDVSNALLNIPEKWKGTKVISTLGGDQDMRIINEAGLYKLIMRSNKPIAQKFQEFVCEKILPSIRKKGEYKLQKALDKKDKEIKSLSARIKKKKKKRYSLNHSVYIITNPVIKGFCKIGLTSDRNKRLSQLEPSAPKPYLIEHSRVLCNVNEEKAIESLLLGIFDLYRVETETCHGKQREWLEYISVEDVKNEMDMLVDYYHDRKKYYYDKYKKDFKDFESKKLISFKENNEMDVINDEEEENENEEENEENENEEENDNDDEEENDDDDENEEENDNENEEDDVEDLKDQNINFEFFKSCYDCKEVKSLSEYYNRYDNKMPVKI